MIVRCRTTSRDIVRRRGSAYAICDIVVRRRRTTSSMIVRRRTTVMRSSHDHRATLIYKTMLGFHHAIILMSYVIVRLSFDCRTISYNLPTILQTLPIRHKPIISSVTTKLRLQYRSRVGENFRNLRCHPSHDVAARRDQGYYKLRRDQASY